MLIQCRNKVIQTEAVSFAELLLPDQASAEQRIALSLIIGGQYVTLFSEDALAVWLAMQQNATCLLRPDGSALDLPAATARA